MYRLVFISALIIHTGIASDIIELPQGKVEGFEKTSFDGRKFLAFEGIPFAKAPIGKLRFSEPQAAVNWNGVLRANTSYTCLQYLPIPVIGFTIGLFHKGFSQSGSSFVPWAIIENPLSRAQRIANYLSCPTNSSKKMIKCMRRFRGEDLISSAVKVLTVFMDAVPFVLFGPVVEKGDNPFLPDQPYKLMQQGKVMDVPWISSNVKDEGIFPTNIIMGLQIWDQFDNWTYLMPYVLDLYQTVDKKYLKDVALKIRHFYFNDKPLSDEVVYSMVKLFSDRQFLIGSEKALRTHVQAVKSPIYYYFCKYETQEKLAQIPGMPQLKGIGHGDDSLFLIRMSFMGLDTRVQGKDEDMMRLFTEFLVSYAKTGKPKFGEVDWIPLAAKDKELNVLEINSPTDYKMKKMEHIGPVEFWDSLPIYENDKVI